MKKSILKISILILFFAPNNLMSNTEFFEEGLTLFKNKKFNEAKFKFEQDIVFNPKSEMSYLYLSKIFKSFENKNLEEQNLNTVILINPKNEEAIYLLVLLKIKRSDYKESERLIDTFGKICKTLCGNQAELNEKLKSLKKNN